MLIGGIIPGRRTRNVHRSISKYNTVKTSRMEDLPCRILIIQLTDEDLTLGPSDHDNKQPLILSFDNLERPTADRVSKGLL